MNIRVANFKDLSAVNKLRKQVNDIHVAGRPDVFKSGFPLKLQHFAFTALRSPLQDLIVAEENGKILGFAMLRYIYRPENSYMHHSNIVCINEFGVDKQSRKQGVATALIRFIKATAKEKGFEKIELNVWNFNQEAIAFYETVGFQTSQRYMEIKL